MPPTTQTTIPRRARVRRTAIVCCHFLRNLAFYRVGWRRGKLRRDDQFWRTTNGNFLDLCVLEWCKLFADKKGKHYWQRVVTDTATFEAGLLGKLKLTPAQLSDYITEMRAYRDRFVAHLDEDATMQIPRLRVARMSVAYLYDYLLAHEDGGGFFPERPPTARRYYLLHVNMGRAEYVE